MSDLATMLRAVIANPADGLPRLVMADWLDEHAGEESCPQYGYEPGEPHALCARCHGAGVVTDGRRERAEFIRCQIALEKTPKYEPYECDVCCATADEDGLVEHGGGCYTQSEDGGGTSFADPNPVYDALRRRESEMLGAEHYGWLPAVPDMHGLWSVPFGNARFHAGLVTDRGPAATLAMNFRRGFVEEVACTLADWLSRGAEIVRATPITDVRLSDMEVRGHTLEEATTLARRGGLPAPEPMPPGPYFFLRYRSGPFTPMPTELFRLVAEGQPWESVSDGERKASAALIAWAKAEPPDDGLESFRDFGRQLGERRERRVIDAFAAPR